jgi:CheY-like chemotaxis protein
MFDLLVTDMNMPEMNGDILVERVRALRPDMPIVLCTGYSRKLTNSRLAEIGGDTCLYKPVTSEVLASAVRQVIDARKSGRPLSTEVFGG